MASFAREILNHKNYRAVDGNKTKLEENLLAEKRKAPQRIPYLLSTTKEFPGKFFLGYLPRVKARVEYVSVTPDGFRYRGRVHATLNGLFKWFKEHFRDPIPGKWSVQFVNCSLFKKLINDLHVTVNRLGCFQMTSWRPYWWTKAIVREMNSTLGPVSRKSGNFSGHTIPFISSQRGSSKSSNFAILLAFLALRTC